MINLLMDPFSAHLSIVLHIISWQNNQHGCSGIGTNHDREIKKGTRGRQDYEPGFKRRINRASFLNLTMVRVELDDRKIKKWTRGRQGY